MSWYNSEDWVHIDDYGDVVAERDELRRQLKVADEDEMYLEQKIQELEDCKKALTTKIHNLEQDIKWLEKRVLESEVPV